jgi:hypothetical protein
VTVTIDDRLDASNATPTAWTARRLIRVALARQLTEVARSHDPMAEQSAARLLQANDILGRDCGVPTSQPITLRRGPHPSPYSWTLATRPDGGRLLLCPDPLGSGPGLTPELLLHVIDQTLQDAATGIRGGAQLRLAAWHPGVALQAEIVRVRALRGLDPPEAPPSSHRRRSPGRHGRSRRR